MECKRASWIMDVVSDSFTYLPNPYLSLPIPLQPSKLASKVSHSTQLFETLEHIIVGLKPEE